MSSSKEYHRRRILIRTMMLLLKLISAAIWSKHITPSRPAIRRPYSKSNGQCRGAAFAALDSFHQRKREQQPITRYDKHNIRQSCSTQLKSAHTSTTHQQQQQQHHETINSRQQNRNQFYQNNNNPSSLITILQSRINNLTSHPAVVWDESDSFASLQKKKLSRRHLYLFDGKRRRSCSNDTSEIAAAADDDDDDESNTVSYRDDLFDQFATVVCHAGVVARKEVFETWAAALYIHYTFLSTDIGSSSSRRPMTKRIVDVAAGHGLLAWALLLLSDEEERNDSNNNSLAKESCQPLTVFCLDVQMPPSAELIQHSMIQQWPQLQNRFDYVEARLEQLVPHPSCLLASVHACGILSDVLVATAAEYQMPLALVPCCHSRKRRLLENCASPFAKREYDEIMNAKERLPNLADLLDEARMTALENAGCDVREVFIPEIFTGKNRLIIGSPSRSTRSDALASSSVLERSDRSPFRKGRMPPLFDNDEKNSTSRSVAINPKARFLKGFYVPCEDTTNNRNIVSEIAGRAAANKRKELMHNRNHVNAPQMDLSIWLPPQDTEVGDGGVLNEQSLTRILEMMCLECVTCEVGKLGVVYISPTGRKSQSFRVQYNRVDGETLSFDEAKRIHAQLRDVVPVKFPCAECR